MNGWIIDLMRDGGEDMHVSWTEVEGGEVIETQWLEVGAEGDCFLPDELRGIFEGPQDELNISHWSGHAGDPQYIGGSVEAIMAANEANLIQRRIVTL